VDTQPPQPHRCRVVQPHRYATDVRSWRNRDLPHGSQNVAFGKGGIVGAILGAGAALLPYVGEILDPVMTVLNAVPRIILAPLFVIWFGIGIASKVAVTFVLREPAPRQRLHRANFIQSHHRLSRSKPHLKMKISARNRLKGKVTDVKKGATTSPVRIDVGNGAFVTASIH
jgi:hypothetical protein